MRSPLSRGAADPSHPISRRTGGDVNNRSDICRLRGVTNKKRKAFLPGTCAYFIPEYNDEDSLENEPSLSVSAFIPPTTCPLVRLHVLLLFPDSFLPSFLSITRQWWALSECSAIAFSHSESLIKLQSSPHLGIIWQKEKATSLSLNASPIHSHDSEVVCLFPR